MPDLSYLPTGLWGEEYQDAGGLTLPDMLQQRQQSDASRNQEYERAATDAADAQRAQADQAQQDQYAQAQAQFIDWPTFQKVTQGTEPGRQYDGYLGALEQQLQAMGYSPQEAQSEVQQFQRLVPRPAEDHGFFGNLYESAKSGFESGTRATKAFDAAGDPEKLAQLLVEQATSGGNPSPLEQYQRATAPAAGEDDTDYWEAIKRRAAAAVDHPQGLLDFFVQQAVQSYPSLVGSAAGGAVGSLAGPVGTIAGLGAGAGAGSLALDVGSTLLEGLSKAAQDRDIDINDQQAVAQLVQDPTVQQEVIAGATAHGLPVAAVDALTSMLSFGLGGAAARAVKAGAAGRATAIGVAGAGSEVLGGAAGERLGQQAQFGKLNSAGDVIDEMLGELGPGIAHTGAGAVVEAARGLRNQPNVQPKPTDIIFGDLTEDDLPSGGQPPPGPPPTLTGGVVPNNNPTLAVGPEGGAFVPTPENVAARDRALQQGMQVTEPTVENIDIGVPPGTPPDIEVTEPTVEEITLQPKQAVDSAEQRIADGRLLGLQPGPPLTATPAGVVASPQQLDDARVQHAATPQAVDLNVKDPENVAAWLEDRGVALTPTQHAIVEDLAGTPPMQRRNYIASVIDELAASTDTNSEALANGLLTIAQTLPKDRAAVAVLSDAVHALALPAEQVMPAVASALAQDVMAALEAGVTSESTTTKSASRRASELAAQSDTPVIAKRGLKRGERPPGTSLSDIAHQLVGEPASRRSAETRGGGAAGQARPRSGLRAGGNQTQAQVQQPVGGREGAGAGGNSLSNRAVTDNTSGAAGSPGAVVGTAERRGLKKDRARQVHAVTMTAEEYEKAYPGRKYDDDINDLLDAGWTTVEGDHEGVNPQQLSPSALRTLRLSPFNSVMDYLASVMATPLQRLVAQQLERLDLNVPIHLMTLPGTEKGRYHIGSDGRYILIDPRKGTLQTVLHEAVHAAVVEAMRNPQNAKQASAAKAMQALFEHAKSQPATMTHYGFTNVDEFVAEALANPGFQKELQKIPLPNGSRYNLKSAWDLFKRLVMRLLGLNNSDNVLSEALLTASDLFDNRSGTAPVDLADRNVKAPSTAIIGAKNGARSLIAYAKGDTYTLYTVTPGNPRGDPATKVPGLSRTQAERYITDQGAEVLPPAADSRPTPGVPKNTNTKLVGFSNDGDLKVAAFQQKDGTWTYYQSDADVRTDPDAKVFKGLTRDQAQRYIAQAGYLTEAPQPAAVKPNAARPTSVGYEPVGNFRYNWQDTLAPIKSVGEGQRALGQRPSKNVGITANLRNTRVKNALQQAREQYVEPVKAAGRAIMQSWGKTQADIEDTMQQLHIVERLNNKIQQTLRGSDDPATQAKRVRDMQAKLDAANTKLAALRNANPGYLRDVQQAFAPKMKALTDSITDMAAQYGLVSRDVAENIKRAYNYYVPLQTGERTTTGKAATGANVETDRSFPRIVEQLHRTITRGETNRVIKSVGDVVRKYGVISNDDGQPVASVGPTTKVRYDAETNSLSEQVDSHTFDPNTAFYYENGDRVALTVTDPILLKALTPYKGEARNSAIAAAMAVSSWLNRLIAVGKTSLNLAFPLGNIQRDVQSANINLPAGVSRVKFNTQLANPLNLSEVTKGVFMELAGGKPTGIYAQAKRDGAMIDHRDYVNLNAISNDLDAIFAPTKSLKGLNALRKHAQTKTFEALATTAQISESLVRLAMYKAAYDSAIESGLPSSEARLFAANAAKTASVNFEQRGAFNLSSWWIFGNAKIQGMTALTQSLQRMGLTKAAAGLAGITLLGYLVGSAQQDGEKDKDGKPMSVKVPDYQKDNKVFLREGGPALSLSQEISPFYIIGHALSEFSRGNTGGAHTASRIFTGVLNNLWPGNVPQTEVAGNKAEPMNFLLQSLLPSAFVPVGQLASNTNAFGSKVVVNKEDRLKRGIPMSDMGSANENSLAVNAAQSVYKATNGGIDIAPQQLHLLNNYFNPLTETYAFVRDMAGAREPKYPGDVVNPVVRRLTANATPSFYDQDQFDELLANATRAKYLATQNGIDSLSPEDQVLARSAGMLSKVQSDANGLFKGSKLMTKERRDLLNERKQELILGGIKRYNELRDRTVPNR